MKTAALCFPHQLFLQHPALAHDPDIFLLIENSLFFYDTQTQIGFHRQKIALHMASMQSYAEKLISDGVDVQTVAYNKGKCELEKVCEGLSGAGIKRVLVADLNDFLLEKRLSKVADKLDLELQILPTPGFINTHKENQEWRSTRKRWHMADFYQWQRRRLNILMENDQPTGGKWSFDADNRKKLPIKLLPELPALTFPDQKKAAMLNQ